MDLFLQCLSSFLKYLSLIAYVPNIFGFKWDKGMEAILMKPYNYTMGLVAFLVAGTTAKSLTDSFNRKLESTNQINFIYNASSDVWILVLSF